MSRFLEGLASRSTASSDSSFFRFEGEEGSDLTGEEEEAFAFCGDFSACLAKKDMILPLRSAIG